MGFELPNGKTARNLQDQVKFLSEKLKDLYAAFNDSGLKKIVIVEELPEVGDPTVLYLLAKEDPEEGDYYDEYLWYDNQWEQIGTTQIDLSDYCTLSTDQTITGKKTFNNRIYFPDLGGYISCGASDEIMLTKNETKFNNKIIPWSGNTFDIGSNSLPWKDLYLRGKQVLSNGSNSWEITNDPYNRITFDYGGSTRYYFQATEFFAPHIKPNANNTYDLGANGTAWKDLYIAPDGCIKSGGGISLIFGYYTFKTYSYSPAADANYDIGLATRRYANIYLSGNVSDGTNSATVAALVKKSHLYTHNITCSNGSLVLIGSFSASITSQSSLSMAEASAVKMIWNNNTVLQIVNGTTIYYFDTSDSTIKTATIGTFTSDSILDY